MPYADPVKFKLIKIWSSIRTGRTRGYKNLNITMSDEWKNDFYNFYNWYITQPYFSHRDEFKLSIDKDFLIPGNTHYSKETCLLLPQYLNSFAPSMNKKGYYFVDDQRHIKKWRVQFNYKDITKGEDITKNKFFKTEEEARFTILNFKISRGEILQKEYKTKEIDIRVHDAFEAMIDNLRNQRNILQESLAKAFLAPIMPV